MARILGLDLGTNSIGWALVDDKKKQIIKTGVGTFQEGVEVSEGGTEESLNVQRRNARQLRRQLFRKDFRKDLIITLLIRYEMFPHAEIIDSPRLNEIITQAVNYYPFNEREVKVYNFEKIKNPTIKFLKLIKLILQKGFHKIDTTPEPLKTFVLSILNFIRLNPYELRRKGLVEPLSFIEFGRILYHFAQRRGFKSSRLVDDTMTEREEEKRIKQDERSPKKKSINDLQQRIDESGLQTLGNYFAHQDPHELLENGKRPIRTQETSRKMFVEEFVKLWDVQTQNKIGFHPELNNIVIKRTKIFNKGSKTKEIKKEFKISLKDYLSAINNTDHYFTGILFYQRPLKSQKHLVGKCPFETNKPRCPISHPVFEKFRALSQINNISITENENKRKLTQQERDKLLLLFNQQEKIAISTIKKALNLEKATKVTGSTDDENLDRENNNPESSKTAFVGNYTTKKIIDLFNEVQWSSFSQEQQNDIWHCFYFFDEVEKLNDKLKKTYQLKAGIEEVAKVKLKSGYGSLSLKAMRKIVPIMERGLQYTHAVVLANLKEAFKESSYLNDLPVIEKEIIGIIDGYQKEKEQKAIYERVVPIYDRVFEFLKDNFQLDDSAIAKLWHPSKIQRFPLSPDKLSDFNFKELRNPIVTQAMYALKATINTIWKDKELGKPDIIRIELARELNNKNKRIAIRKWQNKLKYQNEQYRTEIEELQQKHNKKIKHFAITSEVIEKYRLWKELQELNGTAVCPYTKRTISITDLFGEHPKFDVEHTIPRSRSMDDSLTNKTLCDIDYYRRIKKNYMPSELDDHEQILKRVEGWKIKANNLRERIEKLKQETKLIQSPDQRDKKIQDRHLLQFEHDYLYGKYKRFATETVRDPEDENFLNSQRIDTGYITKIAAAYLKATFSENNVEVVKGKATSMLRREWDLRKKDRTQHLHHAEDAIIVALTNRENYRQLATHIKSGASFKNRRQLSPPWETFKEDVQNALANTLVYHKLRNRIVTTYKKEIHEKGRVKQIQIISPRNFLHKAEMFGKVKFQNTKDELYTLRTSIDDLTDADFKPQKLKNTSVQDSSPQIIQTRIPRTLRKKGSSSPYTKEDIGRGIEIQRVTLIENGNKFRKSVKELVFSDIENISGAPRTIIKKRLIDLKLELTSSDGKLPKKFYGEPIYMPIKRLRTHNSFPSGLREIRDDVYVNLRNNHNIAIYKSVETEELYEIVTPFIDVAPIEIENLKRKQKGLKPLPIIPSILENGDKLIISLKINDMFVLRLSDDDFNKNKNNLSVLSKHLFRVQKLTSGDYFFRQHSAATLKNVEEQVRISGLGSGKTGWAAFNPIKVKITPTGKIEPIKE